jgi:hypothetical protein
LYAAAITHAVICCCGSRRRASSMKSSCMRRRASICCAVGAVPPASLRPFMKPVTKWASWSSFYRLSPVAWRLSHYRALCLALAGFLMYMSGQVWVEFWITGDNDGRFPGAGSRDYPLDHPLFLQVPCLLVPACPLGLDAINERLAASCVVGGIL